MRSFRMILVDQSLPVGHFLASLCIRSVYSDLILCHQKRVFQVNEALTGALTAMTSSEAAKASAVEWHKIRSE
jgi:hypothetical protein